MKRQILIFSLLLTGEVFILLTTLATTVKAKLIQAKAGVLLDRTLAGTQVLLEMTDSAASLVCMVSEVKL